MGMTVLASTSCVPQFHLRRSQLALDLPGSDSITGPLFLAEASEAAASPKGP
jgi:hypothetical protein